VRERYTFHVNYRWFMVDYKDDPEFDQLDRDDHTIAGTFFSRVFPRPRSSEKCSTSSSDTMSRRSRPTAIPTPGASGSV